MAQFAVYRNRNPRSKSIYPLLVEVQSALLEDLRTCVVIPLSKVAALTKKPVSRLMPSLEFEGTRYVLVTPQLASISRTDLGAPQGSLSVHRAAIMDAVDFLLTGF